MGIGLSLTIIVCLLNICTSVLHIFGSYLLMNLYKNGKDDAEYIFLINLGVTEGMINFIQFFINMFRYLAINDDLVYYLQLIRGYGCITTYLLTMIFLTIDRLLDILLNIKYALYITKTKVKTILTALWIFNIMTSISVVIVYKYFDIDVNVLLPTYIYPSLDVVFIAVAFTTYGFIFHKYRQTRVPPCLRQSHIRPPRRVKQNIFSVFKRSRFYIPVLLITTFLIFMVIGDLVYLIVVVVNGNKTFLAITLCHISFAFSYLSDAVIYILIKPSVKDLLMKKLGLYDYNNSSANERFSTRQRDTITSVL